MHATAFSISVLIILAAMAVIGLIALPEGDERPCDVTTAASSSPTHTRCRTQAR